MRNIIYAVAVVCGPHVAAAQDGIMASAQRFAAAEAALQADRTGTRLSPARFGLGVVLTAAGVAALLIDPEQPTQPTQPRLVSDTVLLNGTSGVLDRLTYRDTTRLRRRLGGVVLPCEPNCSGQIDAAIAGSFVAGANAGASAVTTAIDEAGWRLYDGPLRQFVPYRERSPALKYGGAALVVTGVVLASVWSHVPVVNGLAVAPTVGGLRVGTKVGF